jgi:hypothetical protein
MNRGRPLKVSIADQHEMRRYREAGVPIKTLAGMWNIAETTVCAILRKLRKQLGPEKLPDTKKHLARIPISTCEKTTSTGALS